MTRTPLKWMQWNPGLHHSADKTFAEVLDTLPKTKPSDIPSIIHFFEHPSSKWASPGAIRLDRHDHIHCLLGRGLRAEDEAFVIGFTNGSATVVENHQTRLLRALTYLRMPLASKKDRDRKISDWQFWVYAFAARRLYRKPYQFSDNDLIAYRLGFGFGEENKVRDLQDYPFEDHEDVLIGDMRKRLKINIAKLEAVYNQEKMLLNTPEANRLDLDWDEDHTDLIADGVDTDWVREKVVKPVGWLDRVKQKIGR